ncbi:Fimbrial assembly protein (PilN) [Pirellulimonas nuda]|uniref:Fimbrial assembly protein (PilN) n=1 Tax=Pirellulimonas nuda TaxID=2528009 RepID=A0A518DFY9_9BACT|nr:PilN domain-containing protein [Pirellulimonas nuda]QDU90379.1 Fimbrial assembly protein (PilN) [Pirellulimonas nuda]
MSAARINLLPDALARRYEHRRQARRWVPVWCVTAALLGLLQVGLQGQSRQAAEALLLVNERVKPLHHLEARTVALESESRRMQTLLTRQAALEQSDTPLALLQVVIDARRTVAGALQLDALQMEDMPALPGVSAPTDTPPVSGKRLVLSGAAESDVAVSQFVSNLRASNVLANVSLEASQSQSSAGGAGRTFQLRCELLP